MGGKNFITLYKNNGKFYNSFDNDAYILSLIFGYKVIDGRKCGFPDNALEKVLNKLEDYKISYQIIYSNDKPVFKDFKKLNKYNKFYNESLFLIDKQNKIDILTQKLTNTSAKEIEEIMEKLLNVQD